jgi:cytochrome P450
MKRGMAMVRDPLGELLARYERFGPVFTLRMFHQVVVFAIGAEANHKILVSEADKFSWRGGSMKELIPLIGDGLLTIDGEYHRASRRVMLPAFHRERIADATAVISAEAVRAAETLHPGDTIDLYSWSRDLALRIATRALLGFDGDDGRDHEAALAFDRALSFWGLDYHLQAMRGPRSPYSRLLKDRAELDRLLYAEIRKRRDQGGGEDLLGMLVMATDEDGGSLSDEAIRDHAMTLWFAGHDTTTATVTFLFRELALRPALIAPLVEELESVCPGRDPLPEELTGESLPRLERAIEETLRMYPPAWIGPRRTVAEAEIEGVRIPAGVSVNYTSWVTHHLPSLFADPEAFDPDRWLPENRAGLPKGAYVPVGGGSRICIGMRFGQAEVRAIAAALLRRVRLELKAEGPLEVWTTPTLGPKGGLRFNVRPR